MTMTLPLDLGATQPAAQPSRPGLTALAVLAGVVSDAAALVLGGFLYAEYVVHVVGFDRIVAGDGTTLLRVGAFLYSASVTLAASAATARVLRGRVARRQVWVTALATAAVAGLTPAFFGDHQYADATAYALSIVAMGLGAALGTRLGAGSLRRPGTPAGSGRDRAA